MENHIKSNQNTVGKYNFCYDINIYFCMVYDTCSYHRTLCFNNCIISTIWNCFYVFIS